MAEVSRREFLHRSGIGAGGLITLGGLSALLAACGDDDEEAASNSGGGAAKVNPKPKIGLSSSPQPSYLPVIAGPVMAGSKYGLKMTKEDVTTFDSSTTLTQSTLSGQVQIAGQSTVAQLLLIDRGQPFKIFATYSLSDDFVIAGRGDVKTIAQLKDPKDGRRLGLAGRRRSGRLRRDAQGAERRLPGRRHPEEGHHRVLR